MSCRLIRCKHQCSSFIQDADSIGGRRFSEILVNVYQLNGNASHRRVISYLKLTQLKKWQRHETIRITKLKGHCLHVECLQTWTILPQGLENFSAAASYSDTTSSAYRLISAGVPYGSRYLLNVRTDHVCRRLQAIGETFELPV